MRIVPNNITSIDLELECVHGGDLYLVSTNVDTDINDCLNI